MVGLTVYFGWIGLVIAERFFELYVSKRNYTWSMEQGGKEFGQDHYRSMVIMHTLFLVACIVEPLLFNRPFMPGLGWTMLGLAILAQGLRWWVIATLGPMWNTRVVVIPGRKIVSGGPFRFMQHPNYLAVAAEIFALPLIHSAWITAAVFSVLNAYILYVRIKTENQALQLLDGN